MKLKTLFIAIATILMAVSVQAVDVKGKTGIGLRGPVFMPMSPGSDFSVFGQEYEPFMMGYDGAVFVKFGMSRRFALNLSMSFAQTYDDSTATDNQSFTMNNKDNASVKMTGRLLGLTGQYYLMPENKVQPYLLAGLGMDFWNIENRSTEADYSVQDFSAKFGAGLDFWLTKRFAVDVQGLVTYAIRNLDSDMPEGFYGPGNWQHFDERPFRVYIEPSIGLTYYFGGGTDTDNDGVNDDIDQCPGTPEGATVDRNGCPLDGDRDGVYDGLDMCVNTPIGARVDASGCPTDSDNDGVFDGIDKCPNTPAGITVDDLGCGADTDGDGVPNYRDKQPNTPRGAVVDTDGVAIDSDMDGIPDGIDQCAKTPRGSAVDASGCPFDTDMDGVPDSLDLCPGTARGVIVDTDGCPTAKKLTEKITLHIKYASNSYAPDVKSMATLDGVVQTMLAYPETRIEIAGFTDSQGAESYNLDLSQKRANAVRDYLVEKRVPANRISAKGYGENPKYSVGDNSTAEGRQLNRRVEILSVD